jgi:iron complex transport system substrate-binding protein
MKGKWQFLSSVILAGVISFTMLGQTPVLLASGQETLTIVDSRGEEVEVPCPVERIACLNPAAIEVICALGSEDKIVGIDQFTKWNPEFYPALKAKPVIGMPMGMPPNYEKIADLRPQVVISYASPLWYYPDLEEKMELFDIKVLRMDFYLPGTFASEVNVLGEVLGEEERAKEYLGFALSYADKIGKQIEGLGPEEKVKVYYEFFMPYISYGESKSGGELVNLAGGVNIFGGGQGGRVEMPGLLEAYAYMVIPASIIIENPQVIIKDYMDIGGMMMGMITGVKGTGYTGKPNASGMEKARKEIMRRSGFKELDAVKEGKVYVFAFGELATSPRWPVALGYMAEWFYPRLFPDLEPRSFHQEWLKRWHGLEYKGVFVWPEK